MVPTRQSFRAAQPSGPDVDLGLIIRNELAGLKARPNVIFKLLSFRHRINKLLRQPDHVRIALGLRVDQRLPGKDQDVLSCKIRAIDHVNAGARRQGDRRPLLRDHVDEGDLNFLQHL